MDQSLYFLIFIGLLAICAIAMAAWQPPKRSCPECGEDVDIRSRRCVYCQYMFGRV